jgi:cation-transporting ATPase E
VCVVRDGEPREIAQDQVVIDDVIDLRRGDQVVVDGEVVESNGLELDESLLSGEAEPLAKAPGGRVLSGSAVVAGSARMRVTAVGEQAFAQGLAAEARTFGVVRSELQEANNKILRLVTWAILPVAALLCWSQLSGTLGVREALRGSVAGVANMIPEGLVLLTSVAYAVGALRLARKNVLVRELAAVEGLARVDVLCIDKTGTLTTGELRPLEVRQLNPDVPAGDVIAGLAAAEETPTPSLRSLAGLHAGVPPLRCSGHVPFSSERRWSGATFDELGSFVLGAPEVLMSGSADAGLEAQIAAETAAGHRVLLLARAPSGIAVEGLPPDLQPVAFGILAEQVRSDAAGTLAYLREQGVAIKVISGDNPATVAAIAAAAGVPDIWAVDASGLPAEIADLTPIVEQHSVFGRVGPREKRAMVAALQAAGHTVAMTGDGVNDVLALRDADLGIAMGSGSPAARAAGRVVLLDDAFSILPALLAEGRRVLANVERVSKLFVTKTVYAALLAIAIGIARVPYPFYPRNFTVISTLTIGVPAFFLALPPASTRLRSGYLRRVQEFVVPVGIVLAAATLVTYLIDRSHGGPPSHARTAATLVLGTGGLWVLGRLARPFAWWKVLLVGSMAGLFAIALLLPAAQHLLAFQAVSGWTLALSGVTTAVAICLLEVIWHPPVRRRTRAADPGS